MQRWILTMRMRLRALFRRDAADEELDEELRYHVERKTEENVAKGMMPQEARRAALIDAGGIEQAKEDCRDTRGFRWIEDFGKDARFGLRMLRKSPGFTAVALLTLALGIGANSAVFSAIDAVLLRPLPFPEGDRLMLVTQHDIKTPKKTPFVAPVRLEDWNRLNSSFEAMTGYYVEDNSEISGSLPERVSVAYVAPRFLEVWGVAPMLGRDFTPEEERFGGPGATLISFRYWQQRFGGDPKVIGKKLRFGTLAVGIVGVMPASFLFPERDADAWSPVPIDAPYAQRRDETWYTVVGRLKKGATAEQAEANLSAVQAQLGKQYPKEDGELGVTVEPLKEVLVGNERQSFWMLFGAVTLLLLIACTNIAALLLGRSAKRQQEICVRHALGAPSGAIIRQLLAETFVLVVGGAALGLIVAGATSKVFAALAGDLPRVEEIHLDATIVVYSLACSVAVTFLCGLFPAIRSARKSVSLSLAQGSAKQVSTRNRAQWLLAGVQVALAVTLLSGAGLLVRSLQQLQRVSPGFQPDHVLTFHVSASYAETTNLKAMGQRIGRTLDGLRTLPGVSSAAISGTLPGVSSEFPQQFQVAEGQTDPNHEIVADSRTVSPDYFATMKIPVLDGESCEQRSGAADVMVNRSFAETYFGQSSAIGHHLVVQGTLASFFPTAEIRGIVGDAREEGLNRAPVPTVYWCFIGGVPDPYYIIRTQGAPRGIEQAVRVRIHDIEPARSVFDMAPLTDEIGQSLSEDRLRTVLLGFFSATAIALACLGLYGTLSYSVAIRQREIGLCMALGAPRVQIARQFLREGLGVCLAGCLAGVGLALVFGRALSGMLFGVSSTDAATLVAVVLVMLGVAAGALLLPAIQAMRVDPMVALRHE